MYWMREKRKRNASRMTLVFLACAIGQMLVSLAVRETQKIKSSALDLKIWSYTLDNHKEMVCV